MINWQICTEIKDGEQIHGNKRLPLKKQLEVGFRRGKIYETTFLYHSQGMIIALDSSISSECTLSVTSNH